MSLSSFPRLSLSKGTALFICDVQESYRPTIQNFTSVVREIIRLVDTVKLLKFPIVISEHEPAEYGSLVKEIKQRLPVNDVHTIHKSSFSMITKELADLIKAKKWESVILTGVETHVCVMATAFVGIKNAINGEFDVRHGDRTDASVFGFGLGPVADHTRSHSYKHNHFNWSSCGSYTQTGLYLLTDMLVVNMFGLSMTPRVIFRHLVHIRLITKQGKEFILSSYNAQGRGDRISKQMDNQRLIAFLLSKPGAGHPPAPSSAAKGLPEPSYPTEYTDGVPIFAYDGASVLCSLREIDLRVRVELADLQERPEITHYMKDSLQYTEGHLDVRISLDVDLPWFQQTDPSVLTDPRFFQYLEIATSQFPIMKGIYVSFNRGLMVHSEAKERVRKADWAYLSSSVHKACKVVDGSGHPMPVIELDPRSVIIFNSMIVSELVLGLTRRPNWFTIRDDFERIRKLLQEVKCFHYFENTEKWSSTVHTIRDLRMIPPEEQKELFKNYAKLRYSNWPAAVCGTGHMKRTYPLEYLKVVPWQQVHSVKLSIFDLVPRAMLPRDRWGLVVKHYEELSLQSNPLLESFGVSVCNNPIDKMAVVPAERSKAPSVKFDGRNVFVTEENRDWRPRAENYTKPGHVGCLTIAIVEDPNFDMKALKMSVDEIVRKARERKIRIDHVEYFPVYYPAANGSSVYDYVETAFRHTADHCNRHNCSGLILLVSEMIEDLHACLKLEERLNDVPSQHLLCSTICDRRSGYEGGGHSFRGGMMRRGRGGVLVGGKNRTQTVDNIVLKINIKAGGINYTADANDLPGMSLIDKKMFIFGMDVAHPEIGCRDGRTPSCVGISCNSSDSPYAFLGDFSYTTPKQEAIENHILESFTVRHSEKYLASRGELPERLAIFRDGLSEGQEAEAVRECEAIEKALQAVAKDVGQKDYKPKVLYVVVRKRHNTRLYRKGHNNDPVNPLPDTSVAGVISTYGKREIFLQAFRTIQGTSCIPIFWVIRDDENHTDAQLTDMFTAICNLHQIVHSPTSIPTPVYVAHEMAKRGADLLRAYRLKHGQTDDDWKMLTEELSYHTCDRLSQLRIV